MYKKYQLYCVGQKPLAYSLQRTKKPPLWSKDGVSNVKYGTSKITQKTSSGKKRKLYMLSFNYTFEYPLEEVYFAYSVPYSYSQLFEHIDDYKKLQLKHYNEEGAVLDSQILCKSLSGLSIPLITITDFKDEHLEKKKVILLQSRVHPGETHSSWIVHGLIKALISKSAAAKALRS
jgi:hypothetical protein